MWVFGQWLGVGFREIDTKVVCRKDSHWDNTDASPISVGVVGLGPTGFIEMKLFVFGETGILLLYFGATRADGEQKGCQECLFEYTGANLGGMDYVARSLVVDTRMQHPVRSLTW